MSANSTEASSYLSAMTPVDGFFNRDAMLAGRIFASSDSERWYSNSMASSARLISRRAYQTAATLMTQAQMTDETKPRSIDHLGCTRVSCGTLNCSVMTSPAPIATRIEASTMFSMPSTNNATAATTTKKNCRPDPVPTFQQITVSDTKVVMIKVSGAISPPNR